jgi:3D (Asp-Asp-Asp) domain-containing protein
MKCRIIQVLALLSLLVIFGIGPVWSEIINDEESITVEGSVTRIEAAQTQNETSSLIKNAEYRKKRIQSEFQAPPEEGKKSFKIHVEARSYCLRGFTSRGAPTRMGVIAVDPRLIPFGSKIYVPGYGWGTALDTGGAIIGHNIDLWMPTYSQCMQWGVRSVEITVVRP